MLEFFLNPVSLGLWTKDSPLKMLPCLSVSPFIKYLTEKGFIKKYKYCMYNVHNMKKICFNLMSIIFENFST